LEIKSKKLDVETTVGVLTYNAESFIIESLESVFSQTYNDIHLIVSDDRSKDNTVELVDKWMKQDRVMERFLSIQLLTVPTNTGVAANCNRVIKASKTGWIKFHAGDDILLPNCIADNMNYVAENPQAKILFSQVQIYKETFNAENYERTTPEQFPNNLFHPSFDAKKQFEILVQSDRIHFTPSYMFNKNALEKVGFYDESERLVEDYPMWLKLTKAGIRLHYFHKPTVGYRTHANATNNKGELLFKPSVINGYPIRRKYAHPHLSWLNRKREAWVYYTTKLFKLLGITKPSKINKFFYRSLTVLFNPFFLMHSIFKRLSNEK
jgi:alpha-1,3-rhamnosyltransferase